MEVTTAVLRYAALAASLLVACAATPPVEAPVAAQDRPMVVVIHADWCAACKRVVPVLGWLHEEYGDRVTFVDLDITDGEAQRRSASVAAPLGLAPFFARSRETPGITIFGRGQREVHHFTVEGRPGPYRAALDEAFVTFRAP